MRRAVTRTTAVGLVALAASAGAAGATSPAAGKFQGATAQGGADLRFEVKRRHGSARVTAGELSLTLRCDDGTTIERDVLWPATRVSRAGRFRVAHGTGGNYGPEGRILVSVVLRGRFTGARHAAGTVGAGAVMSESSTAPAVFCHTGLVRWEASRPGS